jgi:predicted glycogen debranching enzyme
MHPRAPAICRDLTNEWLLTNGLGGYAMGTAAGVATRRYHGLLMAALSPPVNRHLLLHRIEETIDAGRGPGYNLAVARYQGMDDAAVLEQGLRHLIDFTASPHPSWTFDLDGDRLRRTVILVHQAQASLISSPEAQAVAVLYERLPGGTNRPLRIYLRPVVAFREDHHTTHENGALSTRVHRAPATAQSRAHDVIQPYPGLPSLHFWCTPDAHLLGEAWWYRKHDYSEEKARGLDCLEDLFSHGAFTVPLEVGRPITVCASTRPPLASPALGPVLREADARRQAERATPPVGVSKGSEHHLPRLLAAADAFLVRRDLHGQGGRPTGRLSTVIAGYPWFTDWGRDTMISLPGLALCTGRFDEARSILRAFSAHLDRGMLPNRFLDRGELAEYNTVDATLWLFVAVRRYLDYTGDWSFVLGELLPKLEEVVAQHEGGTRYQIRVDPADGLLRQGEPGVQLTWMDARIGDQVITPRRGKAVEIVALWANALGVLAELVERRGNKARATELQVKLERVRQSFESRFWVEERGHFADVVGDGPGDDPDEGLRPNQLIAMSLPHPLASGAHAARALEAVEHELLTPVGLRTLSPKDPRYKTCCAGDPHARDSAYHQGTIWPWLLGPYCDAVVAVRGEAGRGQVLRVLDQLCKRHLDLAGLGQISEIFDGDEPFTPRGCPAQAWSVAEVLRAYLEDGLGLRPERRTEQP